MPSLTIEDYKHLLTEKERELTALSAQNDILRKEKNDVTKHLNNLLSESLSRSSRPDIWNPQDDIEIKLAISNFKDQVKRWAEEFAVPQAEPWKHLPLREKEALFRHFAKVAVLTDDGELPAGLEVAKAPALLLVALQGHDIFTKLFREPFFAFKGRDQLSEVYEGVCECMSFYILLPVTLVKEI